MLTDAYKRVLIRQLTRNTISHQNLNRLMERIDSDDLKEIVLRVFDMEESEVLEKSAIDGLTKRLNAFKNAQRNEKYYAKIKKAEGPKPIKVLVEGDSWFNYPIILSDVIDWISMERNLAVYSIASAADWLINMLASREYVAGMSVHSPDFFLMSGGGNDVGGMSRVALMVKKEPDELGNTELDKNEWASTLKNNPHLNIDETRWNRGVVYLSKDFFALLMLFRLQYYYLITCLLVKGEDKFPTLKIITQGYDFLVPSDKMNWGLNPFKWYIPLIRRFIGHGTWLKRPLQIRGIHDPQTQKDILYVMMFLFNEMMIELGQYVAKRHNKPNRIFHIDSRGLVAENEWTDEIHPQPKQFKFIAQTYIDCMKEHRVAGDTDTVFKSVNRKKS